MPPICICNVWLSYLLDTIALSLFFAGQVRVIHRPQGLCMCGTVLYNYSSQHILIQIVFSWLKLTWFCMSIQLVPRSKHIPSLLYSQSVNAVQGNNFYLRSTQNTYVGYSESKYRLRISLAHPRDCHFAHVRWLSLSIEKPQTPFREIRLMFMFVPCVKHV